MPKFPRPDPLHDTEEAPISIPRYKLSLIESSNRVSLVLVQSRLEKILENLKLGTWNRGKNTPTVPLLRLGGGDKGDREHTRLTRGGHEELGPRPSPPPRPTDPAEAEEWVKINGDEACQQMHEKLVATHKKLVAEHATLVAEHATLVAEHKTLVAEHEKPRREHKPKPDPKRNPEPKRNPDPECPDRIKKLAESKPLSPRAIELKRLREMANANGIQ